MRLYCWYCNKSVSNEVPEYTVVRAVCICPECIPGKLVDEHKPSVPVKEDEDE